MRHPAALLLLSSLAFLGAALADPAPPADRAEPPQPQRKRAAPPNPVAQPNLRFAFRLYQELLKKEGDKNLFVSPASVSTTVEPEPGAPSG